MKKPALLRYIDWIWHVRGAVDLPPEQSGDEAFDRLAPLFDTIGTSHARQAETLSFTKKDPAAQDRLSVFDSGLLRIEQTASGLVLRYHLVSRALLYCFLAPLLFLAFAGATIALNEWHKPTAEAGKSNGKAKAPPAKHAAKAKPLPMNPIDAALGAPAPDKPDGEEGDEEGPKSKKPSPTPAYVFAGIFVALYMGGRILEDRLVKSLFRKKLFGF